MTLLLLLGGSSPPPPPGTILAGGIGSGEAVGLPTITATVTVLAGGAASAEVVGRPTLTATYLLSVGGIASGESVGRPWVAPLLTILAGSVLSGPVVGRPRITVPSLPDPPTRIVARRADRTAPTVAVDELDGAFARSWQDLHNGEGAGSLVLGNDDPDLADLDYFDVVRFELDGETRFAMLVEHTTRHAIAPGEEVDETTEVSGRGVVAILEDGLVYPVEGLDRSRFSETRVFNFASPELDDAGWWPAVSTTQEQLNFVPTGWPDPDAVYLWDRYVGDDVTGVPGGEAYFRHHFTTAEEKVVEVWVDVDDEYDAWLDGQPLVSDRFNPLSLGEPEHPRFKLDAGDHLLAIRAANLNDLKASIIVTVLELDATGVVAGTITNTATGSWKLVAYPPSPPGFTPGAVLRVLLEEAQARGAAAGVTLGFTDGADSSGNPWPVTADLAFPVGTDLLSVLKQLSETYLDFAMTPALVLDAWITRGSTTPVAFTAGSNLTELTHEGSV